MFYRSSATVLVLLVAFTGCASDPSTGTGSGRAVVLAGGCIALVIWLLAISYYVAKEPVENGSNRRFKVMGMKERRMEPRVDHVASTAHQNRITERQNRPSDATSRRDPWRTMADNDAPQRSTSTFLKAEP